MLRSRTRILFLVLALGLLGGLVMIRPASVEAGIFNASNQVTYKEYWVNHSQFTGGCNDDGSPTNPTGTWYVEPSELHKCPKTLQFTLPDDFSNALKIEIYLDLWRAYKQRGLQSVSYTHLHQKPHCARRQRPQADGQRLAHRRRHSGPRPAEGELRL